MIAFSSQGIVAVSGQKLPQQDGLWVVGGIFLKNEVVNFAGKEKQDTLFFVDGSAQLPPFSSSLGQGVVKFAGFERSTEQASCHRLDKIVFHAGIRYPRFHDSKEGLKL